MALTYDEFDLEPRAVGSDFYTEEVGYEELTPSMDTPKDDCGCGCGGTCGGHGIGRKLLIAAVVGVAIWLGWYCYKKLKK